ncbi:EAL domain-containing protein [Vibrio sp. SCSIO 43135]|uniref:bifunctional diguanylate cyclase/phosphodiesterase n=1 Tax=Vibrio sp. SCSIO 43135 TaxID=2819096 RepID=UPI00207509E4|nr:EAL domain-containing protein [Vibrio sp. SCSIO 43135]USD42231.1 EAL domain-containing protein [Vibrio sp. SCSIO 43135]
MLINHNNIALTSENLGSTTVSRQDYDVLAASYHALLKLNQLSHDCDNLEFFFRRVHEVIAGLMDAKNHFVILFDGQKQELEVIYHVDELDQQLEGKIPYKDFEGTLSHIVIESKKPLLLSPRDLEQLSPTNELSKNTGVYWMGCPLLRNGEVIGVVAVQSYTLETQYTKDDLELLTFASDHIVTALYRFKEMDELQKKFSEKSQQFALQLEKLNSAKKLQESLFKISQLFSDSGSCQKSVYAQVHEIISQLISANNFYIALKSPKVEANGALEFVYMSDEYLGVRTSIRQIESNREPGFTELVMKLGKPLLLSKAELDRYHQEGLARKPDDTTYSWLGVPLIVEGEVRGVMTVQSYQPNPVDYQQKDVDLLTFVAQHVANAVVRHEMAEFMRDSNSRLEEQVAHRTAALRAQINETREVQKKLKITASHDALTGLINRGEFIYRLNQLITKADTEVSSKFAVLFVDIDRFKMVNDSLGHAAGDTLLCTIADELKGLLRTQDTVARLGGDEFVILIEEIEVEQHAYDIAQRINDTLKKPFIIENQPVFIGGSVGVLFSDPAYGDADEMLCDADAAMYHAKRSGPGRYAVFDKSMQSDKQDAISLEADLRYGIENGEIHAYWHPILDLKTGQIVGFESLARWHSPARGIVPPLDFIPFAESAGLVKDIDLLVLEESCRNLKQIQTLFPEQKLYVSSNLYCEHFFQDDLVDTIANILDKTGLAPECLCIELTERALLEYTEQVLLNMEKLKKLGVSLALDDFGIGYSSLSYLYKFPIDTLKIDKSFVENLNQKASNNTILKAVIDLAHNLDMTAVCEGIETQADMNQVLEMGCNFGQGYLFAKPLPFEDIKQQYQDNRSFCSINCHCRNETQLELCV